MQNFNDKDTLLDEIGGEPLAGSGFEAEQAELDFQPIYLTDTEPENSVEE